MSFNKGFELGQRAYTNAQDIMQRERENKWADEQRGRTRKTWEREDEADKNAEEVRAGLTKRFGETEGFDPRQAIGMAAPQQVTQGVSPTGQPKVQGQTQDPAPAPVGLAMGDYQKRQLAQFQDALKLAGRNPEALSKLATSFGEFQMSQQLIGIKNQVLNANESDVATFMEKASADKGSTFKAKPITGKAGMYEISQDGAKAQLNREQLAEWVAARHQLAQGDDRGMTKLKEINADMAAQIEKTYGRAKDTADLANKNYTAESGRVSANASASNARTSAANANKPSFTQLVDSKGEAVLVDNRKLKVDDKGVLQLPTGLRYPKQRPDVDQAAVQKYAESLVGTPVGGLSAGGTKQVHTPQTARAAAIKEMYGVGGAQGGYPDVAAPQRESASSPAAPQKPASYNPVGYENVESTIEGAKRGDRAAIEWLKTKAIQQGATTPAQRALIERL